MPDVFISYSRKDKTFVQSLHEALSAHNREAWVDWEGIPPTAEWLQEIHRAIEASDTFIFIISPASVASDICKQEIAYAVEQHKRLVPIVQRDVEANAVPEELAALNWIFFREQDDFDSAVQTLIRALDSDLDWVRHHTRLLVRAREWENKGQDKSLLLRGKDLRNAETWFAQATQKEPKPTTLQAEYIPASRKAETKRQRLTLGAVTVGLIIAIVLAVIAFYQRQIAEERQKVALSRQLGAQALNRAEGGLDLALLLGLEAFNVQPTVEARSSLLNGLQFSPHLDAFLHGHINTVYSVAFSPDGTLLATGGADNQIKLWNVLKRELVADLPEKHTARVSSLSFSSDGKSLISGSRDKTIVVWDIQKQQPAKTIETSHEFGVHKIALSPDEKYVASIGVREREIIIWDFDSGKPIGLPLIGHEKTIFDLDYSPNGEVLVSGGGDQIILWDLKDQDHRTKEVLANAHRETIFSVTFSPDGTMIASGGDNNIRLWNVKTGQPLGDPLQAHTDWVRSVAFSSNGQVLVSGSVDKTLIFWDVRTRKPKGPPYQGHRNAVWSVAYSSDGKTVASGGDDGQVILWDSTKRLSLGKQLGFHRGGLLKLALSSDGKTLASGGIDGSIILWDVERQHRRHTLRGHTKRIFDLAFSPDEKMLASGSQDGSVRVWEMNKPEAPGKPVWTGKSSINSVAFSPDGNIIAFDTGGKLILWDLKVGKQLAEFTGQKPYSPTIAFGPKGESIVSGGYGDGNIMLRAPFSNASSVQLLGSHEGPVWSVNFTLDGKLLASGGQDKIIRIWDIEKRKQFGSTLKGHRDAVISVTFSPDGTMLASGGRDTDVMLWDLQMGEPVGRPLRGHTRMVRSVAFDPDGNFMVSGSFEGKIVLWDINFDSWKQQACRIANRNLGFGEWQQFLGDESYRETCPALPGLEQQQQ